MTSKIEPRRLKGFRDYTPALMEARTRYQQLIREHARLAGFQEISTPALEYAEILLGQGSEETDKQVYRFEDHGGRKVGLRFDLTVPFARFVAEHQGELVFPFKRLQIGDVWRGENTQKGRYREFCQCDLDIIGVDSLAADLEIVACFYRILASFDLGGFTIRLGNRAVLTAVIRKALPGITPESETDVLIALDKLDKISPEQVSELLTKIPTVSLGQATRLVGVVTKRNASGDTEDQVIRDLIAGDADAVASLDRTLAVRMHVKQMSENIKGGSVRFDCSIARGLGYYTGIVLETTLDQLPGFGSICSGGRYDNLAERFSNRKLPGVGASIGLDRLLAGLEDMGRANLEKKKMIFIAAAGEQAVLKAASLASELRSQGIITDIALTEGKFGPQFKHADRLGCAYVVVLGDEEVKNNTFTAKDMASGQEMRGLSKSDLIAKFCDTQ